MNHSYSPGAAISSGAIGTADLLDLTRSHRTSAFSKTESPEPRLLRGRPLGSQFLVRKVKFVDKGHIITPENAHRDTGEADVIAIGSKVEEIQPGDRVTIRKYSGVGSEFSHDGDTYLVIDANEVLLVLPDEF
jgi:chaperonin GroES